MIDKYFDKIYVLNLKRREDRFLLTRKRLAFAEISNYEVFHATDGEVMQPIWEKFSEINSFFANSSYLACTISHLSIYNDAISKGYERILIVEDDVKVLTRANSLFSSHIEEVPEYWDLLYLGFIPLSDDCSRWDYNVFSDRFISSRVFMAKNLWGLYGYGISKEMMHETLQTYRQKFPMELDRYFVSVQQQKKCYGITPQIFAADDGYSDNSKKEEAEMMRRSVDSRFSKHTDYI